MKVTIKDVAREANVATSTVSRVISNSSRISEETKKKVNEVIKRLNYKPNELARKLVSNKSRILGVIIPKETSSFFSNPFFVEAMIGMSMAADEEKYYLMYAFCKTEEDELKNVKEFLANNLLDGLCLLTVRENDRCIDYLKRSKFPFVVIGNPDNNRGILFVDNDNIKATYKITNKFIKDGYKKIGFIGGNKNFKVSKDRLKGYLDALKQNNIPINKNIIVEAENFTESLGFKAMEKILKKEIPNIVITAEDLLAVGANKYLNEKMVKDIKIIGFNNTPITQYQNPPISSIDINSRQLGYEAAKLLINFLNGTPLKEKHKMVKTKFIER
ncbi:LacI family DNA-binding transcriptional regulator [Clostridium sp.]|uniref:LacI family DNA-binding transcriptional regulator n=1 Tax=Clostridium sp. TaxID=1506 RepID=UPI00399244D3